MEVKVKKHVEVVAAVIKKGDYYFAAKRNEFGEMGGRYEFPGGKIEQGESNEAALIREIKEELNAEIEAVEFIMTVNHEYETFKITLHAYLCELKSESLTLKEHVDATWVTVKDIHKLNWADADLPIVKIIKEGKL